MIVSVNWLKKFTDIDLDIDQLAELIGARLVEVESVINLGEKYKDVIVAKVVEADKVDGSDHLSLTKIDDGGVVKEIERDENNLIQVVCGAPNVKAGQMVAWLPPKTIIPETYNQPKPFTLDSRKVYGFISNGMIASAKELDLFDEHSGILELDGNLKAGDKFTDVYELNDYLLDIENKSLTHRPDTFGIIGFAREVAAIQGKSFKTPDWFNLIGGDSLINSSDEVNLSVKIEDPDLCGRYQAIVVSGVDKVKQTPLVVQTYLARSGVRPISPVVDVTNYLMLLTGQPLHAFDYDKLVKLSGSKADIRVRAAKKNEELQLLDGRNIKMSTDDIVIAAGEVPVGLAGAMGGANTTIDDSTKDIIIESANFNLYNLRATQMRHGIFSEAITRFTKGQPTQLTEPVLNEAVKLVEQWSGAKPISDIADDYPGKDQPIEISVSVDYINGVLGSSFSDDDISNILKNVEFEVKDSSQDNITVISPWWREDIHIKEDIAEEIGRLTGFDNIDPDLPKRDFTAVTPQGFDTFKTHLRDLLTKTGSNEVLTYSFIHGDVIRGVGQDVDNSYKIINSISPNLQYYRQSLTASLLELVHPNIKQGFNEFSIFEINKVHRKSDGLNEEGVPIESNSLALAYASKDDKSGSPYYQAKFILNYILKSLGVELNYQNINEDDSSSVPDASPFEPRRTAKLVDLDGNLIGLIGEYKRSAGKQFKLPTQAAGFELNPRSLYDLSLKAPNKYSPISKYPSTERDICFKVEETQTYEQIVKAAKKALAQEKINFEIQPIDIYKAENTSSKHITIRVRLGSYNKTLKGSEITLLVDKIIQSVIASTGGSVL